jgi:glycosyltransferase involved in cell wall biosynthesis
MKLSIITINKDNALGLERTCQSVVCQTFDDFEWIVIDGASSDNSIDIIKKYEKKITYWISESDTGVFNAMNKGIRQVKGDYCLFLNSGDWLYSLDSLSKAFDIIKNSEEADVYYSDCMLNINAIQKKSKEFSIDDFYLLSAINHQNAFIKRSLFYEHEFYDEKNRTSSDAIFFLKEYFLYHSRFIYINTIISVYILGGISATYKKARQEFDEQIKNIIGVSEFNMLVKRNKYILKPSIILTPKILMYKIIKYLLPYGFYKLYLFIKTYSATYKYVEKG